jgi:phosphohistidine phosphatase
MMGMGVTELYLVRHGEAMSAEEDPERGLSDRGRREVERVAGAVSGRCAPLARIGHSGKLRARQTAEILAQQLKPRDGVCPLSGLAPNDDPEIARRLAEEAAGAIMLVGHLPHLGRLASSLLLGDAERPLLLFQAATLAALARSEGGWTLRWLLAPEIAGG